jgi:predicted DNA-binding protein with PD1-like motif
VAGHSKTPRKHLHSLGTILALGCSAELSAGRLNLELKLEPQEKKMLAAFVRHLSWAADSRHIGKAKPMTVAGTDLLTRRCFIAAAGLTVATGTVGAADSKADTDDLPNAKLLSEGDAKSYLLVFHTGQEVMKGLLAFARKHKLVAGHLTGIGAVSDAVIGYFEPEKKAYLRIHEKGQQEVLALTGNLTLVDNEPFFHIHTVLGRRDGSTRGGHLFEMTVRPTVELVLIATSKPVRRKTDADTGLELIDL